MAYTDKHLSLYLAHRSELVDYATAILGDRSRGEDIVQEAFLRLSSPAANRALEDPVGYLRRIIRNLAIDWLRRAASSRKHIDANAELETVADEQPTAEAALCERDALRVVMQAMEELPERTRTALQMHRFEGLKLKEIASHLGISIPLAHALVYEGLEHCRKRLAEKTE